MKSSLPYLVASFLLSATTQVAGADEFQTNIAPLLTKYCLDCHSGDDARGEVDFGKLTTAQQIDAGFEIWERTAERLIEREMPPDGELQPTEMERERILDWYQDRFVDSVQARPARFRPRRLSATEYRNTIASLLGFDLEVAIIAAEQTQIERSLVMKLLPDDPPGRSGFCNDTHGNPLTTVIWDQYSYLADHGLNELFAPQRREFLQTYTGPIAEPFSDEHAEKLIRTFLPRAFRRPLTEKQIAQVIGRIQSRGANVSLVDAVKSEMKSALMSPKFLYRGLLMERGQQTGRYPVDDFELAERLSYFLWGDMPDRALFELAEAGKLQDPIQLRSQVDRMLESEKARHLSEDFAFQWLALGEIEQSTDNFPLRESLKAQAVHFMHYLFTEDRPLVELIDSDVTFINPLIAKFYAKDRRQLVTYRKPKGIEVEFVPVQKIQIQQTQGRGGILTMPGIVAMNKGPVLRGTWILERILGDHLPDPPMDVGSVAPNQKGQKLTFRQRFEQHRSNATCAVCHDKIDPLGFAFQRYNDAGAFLADAGAKANTKKNKKAKYDDDPVVDTSGRLPSGEKFDDADGLKKILATAKRQAIIRNIVERTLAYALCRKLEIHDRPIVDRMVGRLDKHDGTYRDLFHQIVCSMPFRETRVEETVGEFGEFTDAR